MSESSKFPGRGILQAFWKKGAVLRLFFVLTVMLGVAFATWRLLPWQAQRAHASGSTPIQHIVFIIKENHSFDNYFGRFPGAHGATTGLIRVNGVDQTVNLTPIIDQSPDYCHVRLCYTHA